MRGGWSVLNSTDAWQDKASSPSVVWRVSWTHVQRYFEAFLGLHPHWPRLSSLCSEVNGTTKRGPHVLWNLASVNPCRLHEPSLAKLWDNPVVPQGGPRGWEKPIVGRFCAF